MLCLLQYLFVNWLYILIYNVYWLKITVAKNLKVIDLLYSFNLWLYWLDISISFWRPLWMSRNPTLINVVGCRLDVSLSVSTLIIIFTFIYKRLDSYLQWNFYNYYLIVSTLVHTKLDLTILIWFYCKKRIIIFFMIYKFSIQDLY